MLRLVNNGPPPIVVAPHEDWATFQAQFQNAEGLTNPWPLIGARHGLIAARSGRKVRDFLRWKFIRAAVADADRSSRTMIRDGTCNSEDAKVYRATFREALELSLRTPPGGLVRVRFRSTEGCREVFLEDEIPKDALP